MVKALVASIVVCRCSPSRLVRSVGESNARGGAAPDHGVAALVRWSADANRALVPGNSPKNLANSSSTETGAYQDVR